MAYEAWEKANLGAPSTELSLLFLAERGGELVGVLTTAIDEQAWVAELGVLEAHRGAGIGRALLRRAFAELAARGRHDRQAQRGRREPPPGPPSSTRTPG